MSNYLRLASLIISITLLSGCQGKKEQEAEADSAMTAVEASKTIVDKVLKSRSFSASSK
jgi:hypothetical protein